MSLRIDGKRVMIVAYNNTGRYQSSLDYVQTVREIHTRTGRVWPDDDLLWLDADEYSDTNKQLIQDRLAEHGLDYSTVKSFPFGIGFYRTSSTDGDTYGVHRLFADMVNLRVPPDLYNVENIVTANSLFRGCSRLTEFVTPLPNLVEARSMFDGCSSLKRAIVGSVTPNRADITDISYCLRGTAALESAFISVSPDLRRNYRAVDSGRGSTTPKDYPAGSGTSTAPIKYKTSGGKTIDIRGVVIRVAGSSTLNNNDLDRIAGDDNGLTFEPYYRETSTGFVRIPY